MCSQDLLSFAELSQPDREILWEKRHYLTNVPGALPKVLLTAKLWDCKMLPKLYHVVENYTPPEPMDILQLFLPIFPDIHVRQFAIKWLSHKVSNDDLIDLLPQVRFVTNVSFLNKITGFFWCTLKNTGRIK